MLLNGNACLAFLTTEITYLALLGIALGCKIWDNVDYLERLYEQVKNQDQNVIGLNTPTENENYSFNSNNEEFY